MILDEVRQLHGRKKDREAKEILRGLVESPPGTPWTVESAYDIACAYAVLGEKKNALDWLEKAVALGWKDLVHLEKDSDLDSLRSEERYKKLTEKLRAK